MTDDDKTTQRLGDFEIIRELGRGGMGVVYQARQLSLNREVALKVLSGGLGMTPQAVKRFRREAAAAARLHHTNIVPVYTTGEEDGTHYYALELVDGPSLDFVIERLRSDDASAPSSDALLRTTGAAEVGRETVATPPPDGSHPPSDSTTAGSESTTSLPDGGYFDTVAKVVAAVADALHYAHEQGIVHRDIKPSNLLLSSDGRASIMDFGLARMLEQPGMTATGEFMGSPLYMSPEQITAGRAPLDHRTDIYSLGATLYELLTLSPPFPGEHRDQIIAQIMHKEPAAPRRLNRKVPVDLQTVCLKAMEKDPDRRYTTAGQLAEDLRRYLNRHAISARRVGPVGRAVRWARRHRALSATACFALVVSVAAAFFAYRAWDVKQTYLREQAMDDALTAAMSGDLARATEYITEAETHGAEAAWVLMLAGQVDLFRGNTGDAVEKLETAVEQDPDGVAAQSMLAYAYLFYGQYTEYTKRIATIENLEPVTPEDHLFQGRALALVSPEIAIEAMTTAIEKRPSLHLARVLRADARAFQAMDQESEELVLRALEDVRAAKTYLDENPLLSGTALYARLAAVTLFKGAGKTELADEHLRAARAEAKYLDRFPSYLTGNFWRMHYYAFISDLAGVERVMRETVDQGHAGFVGEPYATAMFEGGRAADALKELDRIKGPGDELLSRERAFLHLETLSGRAAAEAICRDLLQRDLQNDLMSIPIGLLYLLGKPDEASKTALEYLDKIQVSKHWGFPRYTLRYLGGLINETDYVEAAGNSARDRGMAHYQIAIRRLGDGDRAGAREHFEKSAASPVFHWGPINQSRSYAARMARDPEWPKWLRPAPGGSAPK